MSIVDEHYGGSRGAPRRAVRARTAVEKTFLTLGPEAETFLRAAAAAGQSRLPAHLAAIVALIDSHGAEAVTAALERASTFRRFTADDVRSILDAGQAAPTPTPPGDPLTLDLPAATTRPLDVYAPDQLQASR